MLETEYISIFDVVFLDSTAGRMADTSPNHVQVFLHACLCLSVVVQEALERTPFICQSANVSFFKFLPNCEDSLL
jgi:hypothetical protein